MSSGIVGFHFLHCIVSPLQIGMCAQFRNRNVPSHNLPEDQPAHAGALALMEPVSSIGAAAGDDIAVARREYDAALDALHQQRVVMEIMQEALHMNVPAKRLHADASTQTDLTGSGGELPFRELVLRKLQLVRMKQRRAFAQQAYKRQLERLGSELDQLRSALQDATPQGVAMVGVGREGKTVVAFSPNRE